jgi:hypothetical protein
MSRLSEIVAFRRSQGGSVTGSLAGGIKERLKEKFDPRQLINQKGLLTALFPGLKPFKSKSSSTSKSTGKSIEESSLDVSDVKPLFEQIQFNTTITAKNLSVLPSIHRDFNVIRQNIVKLLKLEKIDAATKADMFFKAAAKREEMYESQLKKLRENSNSPLKINNSSSEGSIKNLLLTIGVVAVLGLAFKEVTDALDKLQNVDLKKSFFDFSDNLSSSITELIDSLMLKVKSLDIEDIGKNITEGATNLIPSANASEGIQPNVEIPAGYSGLKEVFDKIKMSESAKNYDIAFGESTVDKKTGRKEFTYKKFITDPITKEKKLDPKFKKQPTAEEYSEQFLGKRKKLTEFTLTEVLGFQKARDSIKRGQGAVGAFQFMPSTLFGTELTGGPKKGEKGYGVGILTGTGLSMNTLFNEKTQDLLAIELMKGNAAYFERNKIPVTPSNLGMAWGIGAHNVPKILQAEREGTANRSMVEIMFPGNKEKQEQYLANNDWLKQSGTSYLQSRRAKFGNEPINVREAEKKPEKVSSLFKNIISSESGNRIEMSSLDLMTDSVSSSVPVVIINNNNRSDTVIVNVENDEPDIFHILSRSLYS